MSSFLTRYDFVDLTMEIKIGDNTRSISIEDLPISRYVQNISVLGSS